MVELSWKETPQPAVDRNITCVIPGVHGHAEMSVLVGPNGRCDSIHLIWRACERLESSDLNVAKAKVWTLLLPLLERDIEVLRQLRDTLRQEAAK